MKIIELSPGIYKVRKKVTEEAGINAGNKFHMLRVIGTGENGRYFLDQDAGKHPKQLNFQHDYEVVSRFTGDPEVTRAHLLISFSDESGDIFEFILNDAWRLRTVFDEMPWLQKGFGKVATRIT